MAYITNANFRRITREFDVPKDKNFSFNDIVIWESPNGKVVDKKNPYIFSWWEVNELLTFKEFCKDTKMAVEHFYRKIEKPLDSLKYVDPERCPAYHCDRNCEAMHSSLQRIEIPEEIREQGKDKVQEFRKWWKSNESIREEKPDAFVAKLNLAFGTKLHGYEVEDKSNYGVHDMTDNRSIKEINKEIRTKFNDLFKWAKDEERRKKIFVKFKFLSFLGDSDYPILIDTGNFTESEIKTVLRDVHSRKKEIVEELKKLYQRRYIPDLNFQTSLLENLGFVPCYTCMGGIAEEHVFDEE